MTKSDDGIHGNQQGILSLPDGINKPSGRIKLLFYKAKRFLLGLRVVTPVILVGMHHVAIGLAYLQFGYIF